MEADGYDTQRDPIRLRPTHRFASCASGARLVVAGVRRRPRTHAVAAGISLRPHLRLVWGQKLDGLIEFPPVTAQGIGYITTHAAR